MTKNQVYIFLNSTFKAISLFTSYTFVLKKMICQHLFLEDVCDFWIWYDITMNFGNDTSKRFMGKVNKFITNNLPTVYHSLQIKIYVTESLNLLQIALRATNWILEHESTVTKWILLRVYMIVYQCIRRVSLNIALFSLSRMMILGHTWAIDIKRCFSKILQNN